MRTLPVTASGANPAGVAGGAILVGAERANERVGFTQSNLAAVADVTPVTLRRYRDELRDLA